MLRQIRKIIYLLIPFRLIHRTFITRLNILRNSGKVNRMLDIGPGETKLPQFETLDIKASRHIDYVVDATEKLPFKDDTFNVVHASHVLEHLPWYRAKATLKEWVRVLKPGGVIEIWVPDGYKLCRILCDIEEGKSRTEWQDGWRPMNPENDPYQWMNGRILYGARIDYPSWHKSILTPKSLESMLSDSGLVAVTRLQPSEIRAVDHGWINLGYRGSKP
jgi:SAM-dependent methyltransferase